MQKKPSFSRSFFENEYPKLLKLTDSQSKPPVIAITLPEGKCVELREFELTETGLLVKVSSDYYLVSYGSILGIQVIPQSNKRAAIAS